MVTDAQCMSYNDARAKLLEGWCLGVYRGRENVYFVAPEPMSSCTDGFTITKASLHELQAELDISLSRVDGHPWVSDDCPGGEPLGVVFAGVVFAKSRNDARLAPRCDDESELDPEEDEEDAIAGLIDEMGGLLNKYSRENASNTPDFILANFLHKTLTALEETIQLRESWYGVHHAPGQPEIREMSVKDQKRLREQLDQWRSDPGMQEVVPLVSNEWAERSEQLWQLLDDIDTLDDVCKDNDVLFRKNARERASFRYRLANSLNGHALSWTYPVPNRPKDILPDPGGDADRKAAEAYREATAPVTTDGLMKAYKDGHTIGKAVADAEDALISDLVLRVDPEVLLPPKAKTPTPVTMKVDDGVITAHPIQRCPMYGTTIHKEEHGVPACDYKGNKCAYAGLIRLREGLVNYLGWNGPEVAREGLIDAAEGLTKALEDLNA